MKNVKFKFISLSLAFMFCMGILNYSHTGNFFAIFSSNNAVSAYYGKNSAIAPELSAGGQGNEKIFFESAEKKEGISTNSVNNIFRYQNTSEDVYVYPGGDLIGIRLDTKGVICVEYEDLFTESGDTSCPARDAKILSGDVITHINGLEVNDADEFERIINSLSEGSCRVTLQREEVVLDTDVRIVKCSDGTKRIGLWVRDNVMGLGTMSFITQDKANFAALGHPISDSSTGITVPVKDGELVGAEVLSIVKGRKNHPGEIRGIIRRTDDLSADILLNNDFGIYGKIKSEDMLNERELVAVADRGEVQEGQAYIITTVDNVKKRYDIQIEKIYEQSDPSTKSMMIRVTDSELIEKTGGIIQGMSGSPIIQNGRLIGAVTHVLTNDPTRGYAIFAEWMIKNCSSCQKLTAFCDEMTYNHAVIN